MSLLAHTVIRMTGDCLRTFGDEPAPNISKAAAIKRHQAMVLTRFRRQARYAATVAAACCRSKSIGLT